MRDTGSKYNKKTFFLYSVRLILPHVPLNILYFIGNFWATYWWDKKAQIIKNDLGMLLGNLSKPDLDRILRHTMQNFGKTFLKSGRSQNLTKTE